LVGIPWEFSLLLVVDSDVLLESWNLLGDVEIVNISNVVVFEFLLLSVEGVPGVGGELESLEEVQSGEVKLGDVADGVWIGGGVGPLVEMVIFSGVMGVDPDSSFPGLIVALLVLVMLNSGLVMVALDGEINDRSGGFKSVDLYTGLCQGDDIFQVAVGAAAAG